MRTPDTLVNLPGRDWGAIPVERVADGIERQMIWGERLMVCRLRMAPHVVTAAHSHPHEQITLVERGRVLFTIADETREVAAGGVLHFAPDVRHGATILEEETVLIDIFTPIRDDFLPRATGDQQESTRGPAGRVKTISVPFEE